MRSVFRILPVALIVAWAMWAVAATADDRANPHEGKVVSAANGKLTMTDKDGKNEHSHQVAEDAEITCDGKACRLDELKKGYSIKVTTAKRGDKDVAVKIEAQKP